MESAAISWYGVTKPFLGNNNAIKVNRKHYCRNMHKELFPSIEKVVQRADSIFVQDGASCHQPHLVQTFLKTKWKRRFIHVKKWSLPSPDVNPLNSFCWELRKTKVVEGKIKEKNKICFEYLCK